MDDKLFDTLMKTLCDYCNLQFTFQYNEGVCYYYDDNEITLRCKTGEDSGGNCWGGQATYSKISTRTPQFDILDILLLQINPDFKLNDYKTIKSMLKIEDTAKSEYYGNCNYYTEYILPKEDLIEGLSNAGINLNKNKLIELEEHFSTLYLVQTEPSQSLASKNKYK